MVRGSVTFDPDLVRDRYYYNLFYLNDNFQMKIQLQIKSFNPVDSKFPTFKHLTRK